MKTPQRRPMPFAWAFALVLTAAAPAAADPNPGAYLAGRAASDRQDYQAADTYFTQALALDPTNPVLLDSVLAARIGLADDVLRLVV